MMDPYTLRDCGDTIAKMNMDGKVEPEEVHQQVEFDSTELPELADWKIGREYLLIVKVKQISAHLDPDEEGQEARFEITQVGAYSPETQNFGDTVAQKLKLG